MNTNLEKQRNEVIEKFPVDRSSLIKYEKASKSFDSMIKSGLAEHRGNHISSKTHITNDYITVNSK